MIKPIDNWRNAWKFASVRFNLVGAVLMLIDIVSQTWNSLPPSLYEHIPNASKIALALFALSIIGRLVKQKGKPDGNQQN